jgi:glycosyltransferase involved in cell wall biosynthesis
LAEWSREQLRVPADRVWYLPNFPLLPAQDSQSQLDLDLPGSPGSRIVCLANLRPEKDHLTLLDAMPTIIDQCPGTQLLLLGADTDELHAREVRRRAADLKLDQHVCFLGSRKDVPAILNSCDIGVLSSASEGLPLSLLEYGLAGLPVVATDVGQCREVLDDGHCGEVVPSGSAEHLARALLKLLQSTERRREMASRFKQRVNQRYSSDAAIEQLDNIYNIVLER